MLEEIYKAINIAMTKFLEDTGKEELEDGDEFITVFNNCSLYIVKEDNNLQTRFIGGKPYEADLTLSAYEENEESHEISVYDIVKDEDGYEFIVVGIIEKNKLLSLLHESGSMCTSPISECRPTGKKADKDMVFAALKRGWVNVN